MQPHHFHNIFRWFALDPNIPHHPNYSIILLIYAHLVLVSTAVAFVYTFVLSGFFTDASVASVLTGFIVGAILLCHIVTQTEVICFRRRLATVFLSTARDGETSSPIDGPIVYRMLVLMVVLFFYLILFFVFFETSVISYIIYPANVGNKMRCIQILFHIELIGQRMDSVNVAMRQHLAHSCSPRQLRDAVTRAAIARGLQHLKSECASIAQCALDLRAAVGWSMLAMAIHSVAQVVVNAYIICSAMITYGIPERVAVASAYGIFPELLLLAVMCATCERCVEKVRDAENCCF